MQRLQQKAYGKLNLFLHITGKRPDGYHTLETVFQTVSLHDNVSIALHKRGGISLRTNRPYLPTDARNIAHKAATAFFAQTGIENLGLYINIRKQIPVGAGMGGGSANAAAVLQLLNRAYDEPLSKENLYTLGLRLGADVPFCLMGGAAIGRGVGEQLTPIDGLRNVSIVLCKPRVSVSTPKAYGLYDAAPPQKRKKLSALIDALAHGNLDDIAAAMENDFEGPILGSFPKIAAAHAAMKQVGARGVMMTGSGAGVFGLFAEKEEAERAAVRLRTRGHEVSLLHPIE